MKPKPLVIGLALASLFFGALLPPEAYPDGKLAIILCASFVFFASVVEQRISRAYLWGGVLLFGTLLVHSVLISVDTYRSLEFIPVLWAYYCLLGFFLYAGFDPLKPVALTIVVLSTIVSGYGIFQYFWGFDELHSFVINSTSGEVFKQPALQRISDRRVFSTLSLPGTLWGFLVMTLPFHGLLWRKGRYTNILLSASVAMVLATGFLTRSFGFLLGLFVLAATWIVLRHRRIVWNRLSVLVLVLALAGGAFYSARQGVIEGSNPASLRLKNWVSAWSIFAANPMGSGLNTYGVLYSRYMLPDANETQYTHNTLLQLLAELGYPFALAGGALILLGIHKWTNGGHRQFSPFLLIALAAWLAHNLVDINVYFPSVGLIGAVLIGVLLRKESDSRYASRGFIAAVGLFGVVIISFSALTMVSTELQHRAQAEFEENRYTEASNTLESAKSLMPINSSLFYDSGDVLLNLYQKKRDAAYLTRATASFERAIALSPQKSGPHSGLSLCLSSANRIDEAIAEIRIAQSLYPDNQQLQAIGRLLERRKATLTAELK